MKLCVRLCLFFKHGKLQVPDKKLFAPAEAWACNSISFGLFRYSFALCSSNWGHFEGCWGAALMLKALPNKSMFYCCVIKYNGNYVAIIIMIRWFIFLQDLFEKKNITMVFTVFKQFLCAFLDSTSFLL